MNAVIENILTRRSIRSFQDKKIPQEDMELIVKAGRYAPSAMNRQTFQITVVQNDAVIEKLYKGIRNNLPGTGDSYNFYGCKNLVLISNEKGYELGQMDCACVAENIFLAARSMDIGSVWINQFRDAQDGADLRAALHEAGVPDSHRVWVAAALGYSDVPAGDKEKTAAVHWCR